MHNSLLCFAVFQTLTKTNQASLYQLSTRVGQYYVPTYKVHFFVAPPFKHHRHPSGGWGLPPAFKDCSGSGSRRSHDSTRPPSPQQLTMGKRGFLGPKGRKAEKNEERTGPPGRLKRTKPLLKTTSYHQNNN